MGGGKKCSVPGCKTTSAKYRLHTIPKNPSQRLHWLKAIRIEEQDVKNTTLVCTLHFKNSDYTDYDIDHINPKKRFLKKHAIPSIFPWNQVQSQSESESIALKSSFPKSIYPKVGFASADKSVSEKIPTAQLDIQSESEPFIPFNASGITKTYYYKPCIPPEPEIPILDTETLLTTDPLSIGVDAKKVTYYLGLEMEVAETEDSVDVKMKSEWNTTDNKTDRKICESCGQFIPAHTNMGKFS